MNHTIRTFNYIIGMLVFSLILFLVPALVKADNPTPTPTLNLEVIKVSKFHYGHRDFCQRNPGECEMVGKDVIQWTSELQQMLEEVSVEVNSEIKFVLDPDEYQKEEYWAYPINGRGDCEDNALEKRRRLVEMGFPRAALRMSTAFHREQFYAHALLLVETTAGTFVLDQDRDSVDLWFQTPYMFEARERVDGSWERFAQDW